MLTDSKVFIVHLDALIVIFEKKNEKGIALFFVKDNANKVHHVPLSSTQPTDVVRWEKGAKQVKTGASGMYLWSFFSSCKWKTKLKASQQPIQWSLLQQSALSYFH